VKPPPEICPNCGADVPKSARACPECGSDEKTGWSDDAEIGGLDLPDDAFDYEKFVQREFGGNDPKPQNIRWFWWVSAILLAAAMLLLFFR
jgi:hypothetical protein